LDTQQPDRSHRRRYQYANNNAFVNDINHNAKITSLRVFQIKKGEKTGQARKKKRVKPLGGAFIRLLDTIERTGLDASLRKILF
jgi:hypothetical protein